MLEDSMKAITLREEYCSDEFSKGMVYSYNCIHGKYTEENSLFKIYVTGNLIEKTYRSRLEFNEAIEVLYDAMCDWVRDEFIPYRERFLISQKDLLLRKKIPRIVIGTKEEIIEYRKKFKTEIVHDLQTEINKTRLNLVHELSSEEVCLSLNNNLEEIVSELRKQCNVLNGFFLRYAFYVPIKCSHPFKVKPYDQNLNYDEEDTLRSGFMMLPYDTSEDDFLNVASLKPFFTPKFFQALYHELFHFMVSDVYRGNLEVNEGLPELYSEFCFNRFMGPRLDKTTTPKTRTHTRKYGRFEKEYMKFTEEGPYREYYDCVRRKIKVMEYDKFREIYYRLIERGLQKNGYEVLECQQTTPDWRNIFKEVCR